MDYQISIEDGQRPRRIRRRKGELRPVGPIWVGNSSKWDNPFRPKKGLRTPRECRELYEQQFTQTMAEEAVAELRGRDLACWCKRSRNCHASFLLRVANNLVCT